MYAGFIYEWTNIANGKKYIGSHKGTVEDGYIGSGKLFLRAIDKYGLEHFDRQIIELVENENEILIREEYYLKLFNCANDPGYYNISPTAGGGDTGNNKNSWKKISDLWLVRFPNGDEQEIKNIRPFCIKHNLNPSAMSAVARGKRRLHKGYWCKKISNNRSVKYQYSDWISKGHSAKINRGSKNGYSKKIEVYGVTYDCMREAVEKTGLSMYLLRKQGKFV